MFRTERKGAMKASKPHILLILLMLSFSVRAQTNPATPTAEPTVLKPAEAAAILPPTVFFQGKTAPVQARNSSGNRLKDKSLILVSLVDLRLFKPGTRKIPGLPNH